MCALHSLRNSNSNAIRESLKSLDSLYTCLESNCTKLYKSADRKPKKCRLSSRTIESKNEARSQLRYIRMYDVNLNRCQRAAQDCALSLSSCLQHRSLSKVQRRLYCGQRRLSLSSLVQKDITYLRDRTTSSLFTLGMQTLQLSFLYCYRIASTTSASLHLVLFASSMDLGRLHFCFMDRPNLMLL